VSGPSTSRFKVQRRGCQDKIVRDRGQKTGRKLDCNRKKVMVRLGTKTKGKRKKGQRYGLCRRSKINVTTESQRVGEEEDEFKHRWKRE